MKGLKKVRLLGCAGSFVLALTFLYIFSTGENSVFAKSRINKKDEVTVELTGTQPYPHQWVETNRRGGVSVFGQVYRPRPDLAVFEMTAYPEKNTEIKSVKIKTADGKIYEGKVRRLPLDFMPQARKNYQNPPSGEVRT